ncbi:hypothetical protein ASG29_05595 [Sphingomonas sp. Leaf412]|uniref:hypothetical protein n=1 Tax=Sphingomonas sp. Leaf412 TaxID=1736370 RepID=UPI0006FAFC58|nr:hypothetical protein [Sphingomonas sp. Leaf412]KQT33512.1 hypothetical protein ASG29_05595 [Sphingomonas sp. Leaf412]
MLRFGPGTGPTILAAPALFEEANRTRRLLVDTLRRLGARGIASALPDLPGQNDSLVATADARLPDWRAAFSAAAASLPGPVHVVAIRGGALVDGHASVVSRWHLSPVPGAAVTRDLRRVRALAGGEDYAGNVVDDAMMAQLDAAVPATTAPVRTVRLDGDPRAADLHVAAPPPWRTSEPLDHPALAATLADDIAAWIAACDG